MRRILLPTDFSENSMNAIRFTINLYKQVDCEFYVLHTNYNFNSIFYGSLSAVYIENTQKDLQEFIAKIKLKHPNDKHRFVAMCSFRLLHHEIARIIREKLIHLVVMGANGTGGGEELLFGSHTVQVMRIANRPLLIVPSLKEYTASDHILFVTKYEIDFKEYPTALLWHIAKHQNAKVHFMYADFSGKLSERQMANKTALDRIFAKIPHQFYSIEASSVAEAIAIFNKTNPIDLLVMVKHRQSFIERLLYSSITHKIRLNNRFPFLVLPKENFVVPDGSLT